MTSAIKPIRYATPFFAERRHSFSRPRTSAFLARSPACFYILFLAWVRELLTRTRRGGGLLQPRSRCVRLAGLNFSRKTWQTRTSGQTLHFLLRMISQHCEIAQVFCPFENSDINKYVVVWTILRVMFKLELFWNKNVGFRVTVPGLRNNILTVAATIMKILSSQELSSISWLEKAYLTRSNYIAGN